MHFCLRIDFGPVWTFMHIIFFKHFIIIMITAPSHVCVPSSATVNRKMMETLGGEGIRPFTMFKEETMWKSQD